MHTKNLDHTKGETFNLTEKEEKRVIPKGREGGIVISSLLCCHIIFTLLRALRPCKSSIIFQTQKFRYNNVCK
jgi:hypothetical protein